MYTFLGLCAAFLFFCSVRSWFLACTSGLLNLLPIQSQIDTPSQSTQRPTHRPASSQRTLARFPSSGVRKQCPLPNRQRPQMPFRCVSAIPSLPSPPHHIGKPKRCSRKRPSPDSQVPSTLAKSQPPFCTREKQPIATKYALRVPDGTSASRGGQKPVPTSATVLVLRSLQSRDIGVKH